MKLGLVAVEFGQPRSDLDSRLQRYKVIPESHSIPTCTKGSTQNHEALLLQPERRQRQVGSTTMIGASRKVNDPSKRWPSLAQKAGVRAKAA